MRFQHTLVDFTDLDAMARDSEESERFKAKFRPKKTTDDVYTPEAVYNAVASWVQTEYGLPEDTVIVRPFFPGGNFEAHDYPEGCLVLDNPPFSIMHKIVRFYRARGVRFFLFANTLTLFQQIDLCNAVVCGADITFPNGAKINISFLTSLGADRITVSGTLYRMVTDADRARPRRTVSSYEMPPNVVTAPRLSKIAAAGIDMSIRRALPIKYLEPGRVSVFGGGALIDDGAAQRTAAMKEAAQRTAAMKEAAQRTAAMKEAAQKDATALRLSAKDARRLAQLNAEADE